MSNENMTEPVVNENQNVSGLDDFEPASAPENTAPAYLLPDRYFRKYERQENGRAQYSYGRAYP